MASNMKVAIGLDSFSDRMIRDNECNGVKCVIPKFNSSPRLGTRARFTYELDRYRTNVLLVIHNNCYTMSDRTVDIVKRTFENHRFKVEIHNNKTGDEIVAVTEEFFRRDFTPYGCVGVVIVSAKHPDGSYASRGKPFSDEDILKYFDKKVVPTLDGKPKLFIVEENIFDDRDEIFNFAKRDILKMRITRAEPSEEIFQYPLKVFCEKLEKFSENLNLLDIVMKTVHEALYAELTIYDQINRIRSITHVFQTFTKELWLWKNP